jgi:uncharacterized protein (DUF2236 family)
MGGTDWVPETVAELEQYVERMRLHMAVNEQTVSVIDFLAGRTDDLPVGRGERVDRWFGIRSSMLLMPGWARRLTATKLQAINQRLLLHPNNRLKARIVRWAYPELPCKQMALERMSAPVSAAA